MPLRRISEIKSDKQEVHRTSNYIMYEVEYEGQDGVDLQLTSTASGKYDKLISIDTIGTNLELHLLKEDIVTYKDCEDLGNALSELSEFFDIIEENY